MTRLLTVLEHELASWIDDGDRAEEAALDLLEILSINGYVVTYNPRPPEQQIKPPQEEQT
jgi:hypothetical protein